MQMHINIACPLFVEFRALIRHMKEYLETPVDLAGKEAIAGITICWIVSRIAAYRFHYRSVGKIPVSST